MRLRSNHRRQAAAIAVHGGQVCLVLARGKKGWVIPKGGIESGESAEETALREAWEEAGLYGVIRPAPVGTYHYRKAGRRYHVTVFVMEVLDVKDDFPERRHRIRRWYRLARAVRTVRRPGLRRLLRHAIVGRAARVAA